MSNVSVPLRNKESLYAFFEDGHVMVMELDNDKIKMYPENKINSFVNQGNVGGLHHFIAGEYNNELFEIRVGSMTYRTNERMRWVFINMDRTCLIMRDRIIPQDIAMSVYENYRVSPEMLDFIKKYSMKRMKKPEKEAHIK